MSFAESSPAEPQPEFIGMMLSTQGEQDRDANFQAERHNLVAGAEGLLQRVAAKRDRQQPEGAVVDHSDIVTQTPMGVSSHSGLRTNIEEVRPGIGLTGDGITQPYLLTAHSPADLAGNAARTIIVQGQDPSASLVYGEEAYSPERQNETTTRFSLEATREGQTSFDEVTVFGNGAVRGKRLDENGVYVGRPIETPQDFVAAQQLLDEIQRDVGAALGE